MRRAKVLFPLPLPEPFDYLVPEDMDVAEGDVVVAPLGPNARVGVVWSVADLEGEPGKMKPLADKFDCPPLSAPLRKFIELGAKYICTDPGKLLGMVLRSTASLEPSPVDTALIPTDHVPPKMTEARQKVIEAARAADGPQTGAELARRAGVSSGVVSGLVKEGALALIEIPQDRPFPLPDLSRAPAVLSKEQGAATDILSAAVRRGKFESILLDGVTGSGKTEVYMEAIAAALEADPNAQVLVMLPEIALTQAVMARFEKRFGVTPAEWHSDLTSKARRRAYREVHAGRARIVAGARSALFLPFQNLRLIIVDEEHDGSYKQDEGVCYQARDLAVLRAKLEEATIVLATATPSLETLANAENGRYGVARLPGRHGVSLLPDVELVDMRENPPEKGRWISPKLLNAASEALARKEQVLFYLNRRGYAPLTLCKACGHKMKSPDTDSWLVEHRYTGRLVCHLTGYSIPKPAHCPNCLAPDAFVAIGPGVERVTEEVREMFPEARVEIFSSDTGNTPGAVRNIIERMQNSEIDILIGTQIVAKGHNFPNLTFVGVVDADSGLKGGDLRAGERTFQVLSQVAGRAGRSEKRGHALLQTYAPEHEALQALARGDRDGFLAIESQARADMKMPPFGRLSALIVSAPDERMAQLAAEHLAEVAPLTDGVDVWGPSTPPFAVLRGRHRRRLLARADKHIDLSAYTAAWVSRAKLPSAVRLTVDVDPYSFF